MVYESAGRSLSGGILAHLVRSAATFAAFDRVASLSEISHAATWSSLHTFLKHYKVDVESLAEALLGCRVLQKVV